MTTPDEEEIVDKVDDEVAAQAAIDGSDAAPAAKVEARAAARARLDDELDVPPRPDHAKA